MSRVGCMLWHVVWRCLL